MVNCTLGAANSIKILDDDDYKVIFGKCIKKLRLLFGISQEDVSYYTDISLPVCKRFETGTVSDITFYEQCEFILQFFRAAIDEFFGEHVSDFGDIFDWMYVDEIYNPWNIAKNRHLFQKFSDKEFRIVNGFITQI